MFEIVSLEVEPFKLCSVSALMKDILVPALVYIIKSNFYHSVASFLAMQCG